MQINPLSSLIAIALLTLKFALVTSSASLLAQSSALPRSTPESQGISSAAILEYIEAADRQVNSMHSFMLVRHGQVVAEGWWRPYARHTRQVVVAEQELHFDRGGVGRAEGSPVSMIWCSSSFRKSAPAEPVGRTCRAMRLPRLY